MDEFSSDPLESMRYITSIGSNSILDTVSYFTGRENLFGGTTPTSLQQPSQETTATAGSLISKAWGMAAVGVVSTFIGAYSLGRRNMVRVHNCSLNIINPITPKQREALRYRDLLEKQMKKQKVLLENESTPSSPDDYLYSFTFRTLFERPLLDVVGGNSYAAYLVSNEARWMNFMNHPVYSRLYKCVYGRGGIQRSRDATSPVITLPRTAHRSVLKLIANQVSSTDSTGFVAAALGAPVRSETFVVALTCEDSSQTFFYKTRTFVIRESILREMGDNPEKFNSKTVLMETDTQRFRLSTVKKIAKEYKENPWKLEYVTLTTPEVFFSGIGSSGANEV